MIASDNLLINLMPLAFLRFWGRLSARPSLRAHVINRDAHGCAPSRYLKGLGAQFKPEKIINKEGKELQVWRAQF